VTRLSFTQPACDGCWSGRYPGRQPVRLKEPETETCCFCGAQTQAGIYVRVDPATVPSPTIEKS
jgi:hypothetical protein